MKNFFNILKPLVYGFLMLIVSLTCAVTLILCVSFFIDALFATGIFMILKLGLSILFGIGSMYILHCLGSVLEDSLILYQKEQIEQ